MCKTTSFKHVIILVGIATICGVFEFIISSIFTEYVMTFTLTRAFLATAFGYFIRSCVNGDFDV